MATSDIHDLTGRGRTAEDYAAALKGGSSDGTSGGMEARIAAVEKRMDRVESKLDTLIEKTSKMEGEISRLPGYPGIAVVVGLIVALSTAAQIAARFLATTP